MYVKDYLIKYAHMYQRQPFLIVENQSRKFLQLYFCAALLDTCGAILSPIHFQQMAAGLPDGLVSDQKIAVWVNFGGRC
jgi:hypothetical protein